MPRPSTVVLILTTLLSLASGSFSTLTDDHLRSIPSPNDDFNIKSGKLLAPILIPRVPGTDGSYKVQKHFEDFFANELPEWRRISQNSTSKTPVTGDREVPFTNWIFQRDPPWAREGDVGRLTLVAHFDSLIKPEGFIGAIDSAAPCAMLMHVARSIDGALTSKWKAMEESGEAGLEEAKGIQILFLDGEEAFDHWTDDDSLYGARSLAAEWETTPHESMSTYKTPLDSISLFVLLDLLGAEEPTIPSYFLTTHWAYRNMADIEKRMRGLNLLESSPRQPFLPDGNKEASSFGRGFIGDDHVPFMERGVEILHLIPSPFPSDLWHRMEDDGEHLDLRTCRDWSRIVTAFAMEWLEIGDHMPKRVTREGGSKIGAANGKRTEL